jgi:7-carboxy-7-deazaguanine synthase
MVKINDIYLTIQGEGSMTGTPMVLIRLQGCSVGCGFCDTKETWHLYEKHRVDCLSSALTSKELWCDAQVGDVLQAIASMGGHKIRWALITGGDPMEQDLTELTDGLHRLGYKVAMETSGTVTKPFPTDIDWVTLSPKRGTTKFALGHANEVKFLIGNKRDVADAISASVDCNPATISLQPISEGQEATALCVSTCLSHGWRLSIQTHKLIGVK